MASASWVGPVSRFLRRGCPTSRVKPDIGAHVYGVYHRESYFPRKSIESSCMTERNKSRGTPAGAGLGALCWDPVLFLLSFISLFLYFSWLICFSLFFHWFSSFSTILIRFYSVYFFNFWSVFFVYFLGFTGLFLSSFL